MAVGGDVSYEGLLLVILNPDENGVNKLHYMQAELWCLKHSELQAGQLR